MERQKLFRRVRKKINWRWKLKIQIVSVGWVQVDKVGVCKLGVGVEVYIGVGRVSVEGGRERQNCRSGRS